MRFSIDPPGDTSMREFALSPDGTALAFVAIDRRGTSHLWLRRFEESAPELIPNADGLSYPFWSPDGTSLGFFQEGKQITMIRFFPAVGNGLMEDLAWYGVSKGF